MQASINIPVENPAQAQAILEFALTVTGETKAALAPKKTAGKKAAPVVEETEELSDGLEETEDVGFDSEEIEPEEKPAKTSKAKKYTDKDVNAAAMAHAKENGRPATLGILNKKFKVKSILELKPEQYGAVITALAI